MNARQESTRQGRWSELLLGGAAAGVGAPLLLGGLGRFLRRGRGVSPSGVGWTAGVLGALVAGGLARRRRRAAGRQEVPRAVEAWTASSSTRGEDASPGRDYEDGVWVPDQRREARRRRLAALGLHAGTPAEVPALEAPRPPRSRRGPSGREQPWHEALASHHGGASGGL